MKGVNAACAHTSALMESRPISQSSCHTSSSNHPAFRTVIRVSINICFNVLVAVFIQHRKHYRNQKTEAVFTTVLVPPLLAVPLRRFRLHFPSRGFRQLRPDWAWSHQTKIGQTEDRTPFYRKRRSWAAKRNGQVSALLIQGWYLLQWSRFVDSKVHGGSILQRYQGIGWVILRAYLLHEVDVAIWHLFVCNCELSAHAGRFP